MDKRPVVLCIMDGFGLSKDTRHNAIYEAKTPNLDELFKTCPFVEGQASGLFVGLPDGQMGNSEVGHLNMGAGRVVYQDLTRITKSIQISLRTRLSWLRSKTAKRTIPRCISGV